MEKIANLQRLIMIRFGGPVFMANEKALVWRYM
jgi:hypothetical protein